MEALMGLADAGMGDEGGDAVAHGNEESCGFGRLSMPVKRSMDRGVSLRG